MIAFSHLTFSKPELRSALLRERADGRADVLLSWITWVYPNRPLTREFTRISTSGYLKGADMWHLAHALFLAPEGTGLDFLTLDRRQRSVLDVRVRRNGTALTVVASALLGGDQMATRHLDVLASQHL